MKSLSPDGRPCCDRTLFLNLPNENLRRFGPENANTTFALSYIVWVGIRFETLRISRQDDALEMVFKRKACALCNKLSFFYPLKAVALLNGGYIPALLQKHQRIIAIVAIDCTSAPQPATMFY